MLFAFSLSALAHLALHQQSHLPFHVTEPRPPSLAMAECILGSGLWSELQVSSAAYLHVWTYTLLEEEVAPACRWLMLLEAPLFLQVLREAKP